jgi:hypothetical protein
LAKTHSRKRVEIFQKIKYILIRTICYHTTPIVIPVEISHSNGRIRVGVPDNIYDKDKQLTGSDYKNNNNRVQSDRKNHNILVQSDHYDNKTHDLQVLIYLKILKKLLDLSL